MLLAFILVELLVGIGKIAQDTQIDCFAFAQTCHAKIEAMESSHYTIPLIRLAPSRRLRADWMQDGSRGRRSYEHMYVAQECLGRLCAL